MLLSQCSSVTIHLARLDGVNELLTRFEILDWMAAGDLTGTIGFPAAMRGGETQKVA